jgi:N-acetyl-anhydromuramyl-L-alanine amidase AmpD
MLGSRTFKTLTILLVTMTAGAYVLMLMESAPIRLPARSLAALSTSGPGPGRVVAETDVPLRPTKWRNIIVHAHAGEPAEMSRRMHFVIRPGENGGLVAEGTDLWKRQADGHHVYVPWRDFNADSIGICLIGRFSRTPPTDQQFQLLVNLVRTLQSTFRIPGDQVYLHSDLDGRSVSPGRAFPARTFTESLLHAE